MPSDITKATTWSQVRKVTISGSDEPPSDNSDVQPSGEATENYTPAHTAADYPESSANQKQAKIGDKGKLIGYRKAQEHVMKSLENPEIVKALDLLERHQIFKALDDMEKAAEPAEEKADEEKSTEVTPADVTKVASAVVKEALAPLSKQLDSIMKALAKSQGSDLQKSGFVPVGSTGKPDIGAENKAAPYTKDGQKIMKAADGSDSLAPSFEDLAGTPLHDITRGI